MKKFNDFINENIKNYDDCDSLANLLIQNYSIEDIPTECHYNLVDKLCELYDDGLIKTKDDMKKYIDQFIESGIINSFYEKNEGEIINESTELEMDYFQAFNQFIKGRKVMDYFSVEPYGDYDLPQGERYYGDGIVVEGDYKMISHGGGCSGEDCNISFILSPDNKIISTNTW